MSNHSNALKELTNTQLMDFAVFLVEEFNKRGVKDHLDIGVKVAREMGFFSTDIESLLMGMSSARTFGVPHDMRLSCYRTILNNPLYKHIETAVERWCNKYYNSSKNKDS